MFDFVSEIELSGALIEVAKPTAFATLFARASTLALLLAGAVLGLAGHAFADPTGLSGNGGILQASDHGSDSVWVHLPGGDRIALNDAGYASTTTEPPPSVPPPANPADNPLILPPQNGAAEVPPPEPPAETDPLLKLDPPLKEEGDVADDVLEAEKEEKKEEEKKPLIADFAKGILIQQNDGDLTFVPGMRIQPRYNYDANFHENDFFINRFRLKGSGSAYGIARYLVELQLDGTSRFQTNPIAQDQNAWIDFTFEENLVYFRVGLFDLPFSRDAMTSDSKLLIMDRSLIRGELAGLGLADDTVGFLFHGRPHGGHVEYAFGLFDDFAFEKRDPLFPRETDQLMPAFRLGAALLDPYAARDGYADYWASYLGKQTRLDLGVNAAHLGEVFDGPVILDLTGVGGDIFASHGHYSFQAEYDFFVENIAFIDDIQGRGWYVQGGYLFDPCDPCLEFAVRYQELDSELQPDILRWTSVGFNWYIRDHNFKVQTDYTFRDGEPLGENVYALQFQLDF
jgi:hypothetical protein